MDFIITKVNHEKFFLNAVSKKTGIDVSELSNYFRYNIISVYQLTELFGVALANQKIKKDITRNKLEMDSQSGKYQKLDSAFPFYTRNGGKFKFIVINEKFKEYVLKLLKEYERED